MRNAGPLCTNCAYGWGTQAIPDPRHGLSDVIVRSERVLHWPTSRPCVRSQRLPVPSGRVFFPRRCCRRPPCRGRWRSLHVPHRSPRHRDRPVYRPPRPDAGWETGRDGGLVSTPDESRQPDVPDLHERDGGHGGPPPRGSGSFLQVPQTTHQAGDDLHVD